MRSRSWERDRARATQVTEEIGSIVIAHDGCEASISAGRCQSADIVAAVTGDDETISSSPDGQHHFDVRNDRQGQHTEERRPVQAPRRRRDRLPTRMILGSIEADNSGPRAAPPGGARGGELELVEAQLREGSPAIGQLAGSFVAPRRMLDLRGDPRGSGLSRFAPTRSCDRATRLSVRPDRCEGELHGSSSATLKRSPNTRAAGRRRPRPRTSSCSGRRARGRTIATAAPR